MQNGINAIEYLGGTSTCGRTNKPRFASSILELAIIKQLPQKENLIPTSATCTKC